MKKVTPMTARQLEVALMEKTKECEQLIESNRTFVDKINKQNREMLEAMGAHKVTRMNLEQANSDLSSMALELARAEGYIEALTDQPLGGSNVIISTSANFDPVIS